MANLVSTLFVKDEHFLHEADERSLRLKFYSGIERDINEIMREEMHKPETSRQYLTCQNSRCE